MKARLCWAFLGGLALAAGAGCAGVSPARGHDEVSTLVQARTGQQTGWQRGRPDDAQLAAWVHDTVARGLTRARVVQIALVNNPDLRATYEDLGVSQADMVQAGLLHNPSLGVDLGFRLDSGVQDELRLSLVQDFLDLFVLPLRKEMARAQFEADTLRVAQRALDVAAEAEKALVAVQASVELVAQRKSALEAGAAAAELASRQFEAGNINELEWETQRSSSEQARLDLARDELDLLEARERLNRLLGLWGESIEWRLADGLPALPSAEPSLEHLEALAVRQRLDIAAARRQAELLLRAVDLARDSRLFGRVEVGVDMHQDPNGPRLLGPNLVLELPVFDQRQAMIARLEAQQREQESRLAALAIDARSEVRLADARVRAGRQMAVHYRDVLVPIRIRLTAQAQLHYNGMFISAYQLLAAKQGEIDARRGYLQAVRDYWIARVELARAAGGRLFERGSETTSPPPPRAEDRRQEGTHP